VPVLPVYPHPIHRAPPVGMHGGFHR
jgi:hypothetical protein